MTIANMLKQAIEKKSKCDHETVTTNEKYKHLKASHENLKANLK